MGTVPTLEEAESLLEEYNENPFHLKHGKIVSGIMGYFAKEYDPENVDFWKVAGLLHDLDFEKWPEQHCIKEQELMRERGIDERLIHAVASHGYGLTVDIKPEHMDGENSVRNRRADGSDWSGSIDAPLQKCARPAAEIG